MFFIYKNRNSKEFGIKIKKINDLSTPKRSIEKKGVPGRNGDLVIDVGNYENFTLSIECDLDSRDIDIENMAMELTDWLQKDFSYGKLYIENRNYYYEAYCSNALEIERMYKNFGEFVIEFDCKPFKRIVNYSDISIDTKDIDKFSVFNSYDISYPVIEIFGNGDINIKINTQKLILKGVKDNIIIDSDMMNAYKIDAVTKKLVNENSKMFSEFPTLEHSENKITWEGEVNAIEINPNWIVL
ncbi:phage tail protein [Clostridioides difficile]|uniref:phage tail domain-containing protein n=1 Tax=Clostridioides difficile TaxID=1496 RepID=UPI000C9BB0B9|nr:phage tail domain-containing protein [Clostridioides difficile]MBY1363320.1 phage tail protein [Clostridioides difficile]MCJ1757357.1 phage tail protein [Clostridioides difficile]MCK1903710.1 phage tail protein [Clostridioides difficile]MCP8416746.1 phage tail protein [Clostridioides difficile]MCP8665442.1 phage tail protein [Clostridioides difficile]